MNNPKIAVIGGGILGISCALELSTVGEVTVFEQEQDIMMWGTYGNQYRHHLGYHYPRSPETVEQCLKPQADFLSLWKEAVISDFISYYAIAQSGSRVSEQEFLDFCDNMGLPHKIGYPDDLNLLNRQAVGLCIETAEGIYDFLRLKNLAKDKLVKQSVILKLGNKIVDGKIDAINHKKSLHIKTTEGEREEIFDYVIGAMYANHNLFGQWFGFDLPAIELRLKEVVIVKLPISKRVGITIMDGPFSTIVPMAETGCWTLGDVPRSVHEKTITTGGVPWTLTEMEYYQTRFEDMKIANRFYIPILSQAEYVKSMFTVLPILPDSDKTDRRLTTVHNYGQGCWSVFEGKIVTCVTAAKEVKKQLTEQLVVV